MPKIKQMQEQLKYLQLKRGDHPINWSDIFRKMEIPNPEMEIKEDFLRQVRSELAKLGGIETEKKQWLM